MGAVTNSYRSLVSTDGARSFLLAGFVMRMPISMNGLAIVLLVSATRDSYTLAGAVSATYTLAAAVASPLLARLVDRRGQARVIVPALAVHVAGGLALVAGASLGAPPWVLIATAVVVGAGLVPVGSLVRARWSYVVGGTPLLARAYSFESVVDEVIFILGPVIVTLLATEVAPGAGLLAGLAFAAAGTVALAPQRRTEPPPRGSRAGPEASALRVPGIRVLAFAAVGLGGIFGTVEVATVAFADERGRTAAAAVVLALFALGSLISGLAYGAIPWRMPLARRFLVALVVLVAAVATFPLTDRVEVLAAVAFVSGFAISPTIIGAFALVETLAPPAALTEGLTWMTTGLGAGIALAASVAGRVIDASGARSAFVVALVSGAVAVVLALSGARRLAPRPCEDRIP